ncbi:MAG: hypothetical protein HFG54_10895 [Lachnospiraceae bacterium]|jgi:hypothetical protein|nr:hypothetical protein [Lachnospiraceae bacterium]
MNGISMSKENVQDVFTILQNCLEDFQKANKALHSEYEKIVLDTNNKRYLDLGNEIFDSYNKEINDKLRRKMMEAWGTSSASLSDTLKKVGAGAKAEELARIIEKKIEETVRLSGRMTLLQQNLSGEVVSDDRDYDKIIQLLSIYENYLNESKHKYENTIKNKSRSNQLYRQLNPVINIIFGLSENFMSIINGIVEKEKENFIAKRLQISDQSKPSGMTFTVAGAAGSTSGATAGMVANTAGRGAAVLANGGVRQNTAGAASKGKKSIEEVLRYYAKLLINEEEKEEIWKKLTIYILKKIVIEQTKDGQSHEQLVEQLMIIYETYFNFTRIGVTVKSANEWKAYTNKKIAAFIRENPGLFEGEKGWDEKYSPGVYSKLSRLIQENCKKGTLDKTAKYEFMAITDLIINEIQLSADSEYEYPKFCVMAGEMILSILNGQSISPGYQFLVRADIKEKKYKDVQKDIGIRLFEEMYKDWHEVQVSNEEKAAICKYTSKKDEGQTDIYKLVNNVLRGEIQDESGIYLDIINKIREALRKTAAPDNILLYRSASLLDFKELAQTADPKEIARMLECEPERFIGKTLEIPTFLSTTVCETIAGDATYDRSLERYELVIQTPKGTLAGFLPLSEQLGFTKHGGEKEVLLTDGMILQIKKITLRSPEERRFIGGSNLMYKVTVEIVDRKNQNIIVLRGDDFDESNYSKESIEGLKKIIADNFKKEGGIEAIAEACSEEVFQFFKRQCDILREDLQKQVRDLQSERKKEDLRLALIEKGLYGRYSVNNITVNAMRKCVQTVNPVLDRLDKACKDEFDKKIENEEKIAYGYNLVKQAVSFLSSTLRVFALGKAFNGLLGCAVNNENHVTWFENGVREYEQKYTGESNGKYECVLTPEFSVHLGNYLFPYLGKVFGAGRRAGQKQKLQNLWTLTKLNMEIAPSNNLLEQYIFEHYNMKLYKKHGLDKNSNPFSKKKALKFYEQKNLRWSEVHWVLYNVTDEKARRVFEDAYFTVVFYWNRHKNGFGKCKNKEEQEGIILNLMRAAMVRSDYSQTQTATGMIDSLYDYKKNILKITADTSKYPTEYWTGKRIES